jgi:hypothetical protein
MAILAHGWAVLNRSVMEPLRRRQQRIGQVDVASQIARDCYWFSEDKATFNLLQKISEGFLTNGCYNVNILRDEWRKEKEQKGSHE